MVDTARTKAEILALLADNNAGDISPQDVRDMVVSLIPAHGGLYRNVAAPTTVTVAGTYYKAAGTTTAGELDDLTMPQDNRLTYIGVPERHFHILATISMTCDGINKIIGFKIAKNGTPIDGSVSRRRVGTGTDIGALAVQADVALATNDYVEIWVTNETTNTAVTLDEFHLHMSGILE